MGALAARLGDVATGAAGAIARTSPPSVEPIAADKRVVRVLHVVETALGGCGTYLNEIVPLQAARLGLANVRVVAPDRHLEQMRAIDPSLLRPFRRSGRLSGLFHLGVAVMAALRRDRPTVVHAHSTFAGVIVRLLGLVHGRSVVIVYCPHGWAFDVESAPLLRRAVRFAERVLALCCDQVIAISHAERQGGEAAGIPDARISVIHNGIAEAGPDVDAAAWPTGRRKVLFVGRLDPQKGLDILLDAVAGIADRVAVRVVGRAVVADDALPSQSDDVEYLGWLDAASVTRQMRACDVLVVPSRWEGFGLVALEAMRVGKPVIASTVGGLPEIVVDGVTGRLVRPADPRALRDALLGIGNDELRRMGEAGRTRFLRLFTSDRLADELDALYRSLLVAGEDAALRALAAHV